MKDLQWYKMKVRRESDAIFGADGSDTADQRGPLHPDRLVPIQSLRRLSGIKVLVM